MAGIGVQEHNEPIYDILKIAFCYSYLCLQEWLLLNLRWLKNSIDKF